MKRIVEFFESLPMTIVSGVFIIAGLLLPEGLIPLDPAWIAVIISGLPLLYSAIRKLIRNNGISKISSALLISIAMIASVAIGDVFAAGEIAFIMAIGEILEDKTTARARKGLKELISLAPANGRLIIEGREEVISAEKIQVGDILRILPGEAIPVDGEILSGETSIDQSVITGESIPVDKSVGDGVFCGTINRFGVIEIRASKVGADSSLQKLIRMVRDADNRKAPMQRIADKWASLLVPVALIIALLSGIIKQDIVVGVTMLVVFCPCALVLATPTAIMAAIGQATKQGVIIKSGEALEKMGKIDTVAFDKTGTLTCGKLEVSDIVSFNEKFSGHELLRLTASAESKSEHPLGQAVVTKAKAEGIELYESENFRMAAGKGVFAEIGGNKFFCGNEKLMSENNIKSDNASKTIEKLRNQGKATIIVASEREIIGVIALCDVLKTDVERIIEKLTKMGVGTVLLTGDNKKTANYFAEKAGIKQIKSELLPEQKVECIAELQSNGKKVCMIGDGINDAPALKAADVGVAMGSMGSDIAVDAADIAVMGDDISKIPYLKRLSKATVKTIKFSIFLSLLINFLAIILSFFELLNPTTGALVHNAGSIFVILIAALLYERKFD